MRYASIATSTLAMLGCATLATRAGGPAATPDVRNAHALFHDASQDEVVLFGGADAQAVRGDTWAWNGASWRHLADDGRSPRTFAAVAGDGGEEAAAYLFGGNRVLFGTPADTATFLDDLWTWTRGRWRRREVTGLRPGARAEAAMAFDRRRGRLVLFGGRVAVGGRTIRFGDTWEWDGERWTRMDQTGPSPRSGMAMAFDDARGVTVLFGGSTGITSGETWEWDGIRWTLSPAITDPRFNPAMTYDGARRQVVRFGGWYSGRRWGDTWIYEGQRWVLRETTGPAPRNHAALAYDARRNTAVLVGGHDGSRVFGDVWEWRGDRWREVARVEPKARIENGH